MLTYEAEYLLPYVLDSVLPYVKEAHITDTGSKDRTREILAGFQRKYPFLDYNCVDVSSLGTAWVDRAKNIALTKLLNDLKSKTKAKWILKIDDDEVFPKETMEEILSLDDKENMYLIYFHHFEGNHILDKYYHRKLRVIRLFKNIPEITWEGAYGYECVAYNKKRISTGKCKGIYNPFLHFGEYRTGKWKHDYRFHEKGHCGLPIPKEFLKYVPK